jgi:hypothetical protein
MHGTISSIWLTNACVPGGIYRPASFETNLDNDSDIDQSGCTALPTCRRHVVNGTHCVGVSVLTNRLREMHALGGHCLTPRNARTGLGRTGREMIENFLPYNGTVEPPNDIHVPASAVIDNSH